jgi:choline-sulfatase
MRRKPAPAPLAALLALALGTLGSVASLGSEPARPNLLLITLDTTRADHLGCYGYKAAETPVLDGLATGGALFEEAHAHVPLTLPSHATLLTGDAPSTLNLRVNGMKLKEGTQTLAVTLKARGYWTGAVVSAVILERGRGLAEGFDTYDDHMTLPPRSGGPPEERPGEETTQAALAAAGKAKGPYFLWVHYFDPHYEYRPPPPYAARFAKNPYDGEIAYMDASIGKLLAGLRAQGKMENTLVVVSGDHGEGLGEHGEQQHGVFLYEYAMHVPLLMSWEGKIPGGTKVRDLVGLDDVAPTVLDFLGVQGPKADGHSLRPLLAGKTLPTDQVYLESYHGFFTYGWAPLRGIMDPRWKFIQAPRPELYEWQEGEQKNQYSESSPAVAAARKAMERYPAADPGEQAEMERFLKDPSNQETLKQLMSLGYLSGGGTRPDQTGLLDPKDAIGIEENLREAMELSSSGQLDKAVQTLVSILKRNPQNVPALSMLGLAYLNSGRNEQAVACFTEEVKLKPQMDTAHLNLGTAYLKLGRKGDAEKEYRAALAVNPRMPEAVASLGKLLVDQRRYQEARAVLEPASASGLESADIYFELGILEGQGGNAERARYYFSKCIAMDPRKDEAMANLGNIAFKQGKVDEAIAQYERAARLAPRKADYLATLGALYLNGKGDQQRALQYFERALAVNPYGPEAANLKEMIQGLREAVDR